MVLGGGGGVSSLSNGNQPGCVLARSAIGTVHSSKLRLSRRNAKVGVSTGCHSSPRTLLVSMWYSKWVYGKGPWILVVK